MTPSKYSLIQRQILLKTSRFKVVSDNVEDSLNDQYVYTYLKKPNAAGIIAIRNASVLLVEQYRYVVNRTLLELPGGRIDKGESPKEAAARELEEEVGFKTDDLQFLMTLYPLPSVTNEQIYIFWTDEIQKSSTSREPSESDISFQEIPLRRLPRLLNSDKIASAVDARSLYTFLHREYPELL